MYDVKQNPYYFEKNPARKDGRWASEIITLLRRSWTPLVDPAQAKEGMQYLMNQQSLDKIKSSFKDGDWKTNTNWIAVSVFEHIRNILVGEFLKGSYTPQVRAIDPAAESERKSDMMMLENRALIEAPMNDLARRVGDPPYKLPRDQFNGNVESFDEMGLDEGSSQDLSFFRRVYHLLGHEIAAQELVTALYKYNEFDTYVEDLVNDLLAKKAIAFQQYESKLSGEIKWRYLLPEQVKWIKGRRKDGKDAVCLGVENLVTVREFLEVSAGYFDFDRDRGLLLQAVSYANGISDWVDLRRDGAYNGEGECVASFSQVLGYNLQLGYMEWRSVDASAVRKHKTSGVQYPCAYDKVIPANSPYIKEVSEVQNTYKAWFIATGLYGQYIWNFGRLYHTLTYGGADEFSAYSISVWVGSGQTATQIAKPFVDLANKAFYKMMWGIDESMPRKRVYNYEALAQLVGKIGPSAGAQGPVGTATGQLAARAPVAGSMNAVMDLISKFRTSLVEMYTIPENDNIKLGGNQRPHYTEEGGIDPIAIAMQTVMEWAEMKVKDRLGINQLREAYTPDPKDGFKLNMEAMKQSRNATYYIPMAIQFLMRTTAQNSLNLGQDILELGSVKGTEFLRTLIGSDQIALFRQLERVPLHRYGIFVDVFNAEEKRQEVKQEAAMAWSKGDIAYHEYLLIKETDDYKKAAMTLAFFRERADRKKEQEAQALHQRAMELQQAKTEGQLQIEDRKGMWAVKEKEAWGEFYMRAHQIPQDAKVHVKQMEMENNGQKMMEKASSQIAIDRARKDGEQQAALPAAEPPEPGPSPVA